MVGLSLIASVYGWKGKLRASRRVRTAASVRFVPQPLRELPKRTPAKEVSAISSDLNAIRFARSCFMAERPHNPD